MNERASRWILFAMLAFGIPALSACGRGEPPPETYVLGRDVPAGRINQSQLDTPIVELMPVRIPDYQKFSLSQPIGKGSDAEIVAAMTSLVDQLAASMAPAFEVGVEPRRTASR